MIRNIIFDMGKVLIRFDPDRYIARLGITGEDADLLNREVFRSMEWVQMDHGTLVEEQAVASMCTRIPQRLHWAVPELVCKWDQPIDHIPGMYELVEELKNAGYRIYLLSNASVRQHEYWPRIECSKFFDGTLISADEKVMKPNPVIYQKLLEKFSLKAEECFFIDDAPANIEGAYCCGISGFIFHYDVSALRRRLREMGVNVKEN